MGDSKRDFTVATFDLIYLSGCAVNGMVPDLKRVERMDMEKIHALSGFHSLTAVSCMALEDAYAGKLPEQSSPGTELFRKWVEDKNHAIYKNLMFDNEREQLLTFLEESGIWYMPLKGILIKDLYPKLGMRQMSDNDILFDAAYRKQVHDWFLRRGYEVESYEQNFHSDNYHKKPIYNFEMHKFLFDFRPNPTWQEYYTNIQDRMILNDNSRYGYHLNDEDFYVYMIAHSCKHHDGGGTGLRSLLDCYVYNKAKGNSLDRSYIYGELEKLGIAAFEETIRDLSQKLFACPECDFQSVLTEKEAEMLLDFASAGTYGTIQRNLHNKLAAMEEDGQITGQTKCRYVWRRIFPDLEFFKHHYPFFYRHKWLLPVGYIYRLVYKGIKNREKLSAEVHALFSKDIASEEKRPDAEK